MVPSSRNFSFGMKYEKCYSVWYYNSDESAARPHWREFNNLQPNLLQSLQTEPTVSAHCINAYILLNVVVGYACMHLHQAFKDFNRGGNTLHNSCTTLTLMYYPVIWDIWKLKWLISKLLRIGQDNCKPTFRSSLPLKFFSGAFPPCSMLEAVILAVQSAHQTSRPTDSRASQSTLSAS